MAWNQLSHIVPALATVWLLPYPQLPLSSLVPHRSILPVSSAWLLYIAVSISALPRGWSCHSRLWEICVGNPIWSSGPEWVSSFCLWTQAGHRPHTDGGLSVPGWKERSEPTALAVKIDVTHLCASTSPGSFLRQNGDDSWVPLHKFRPCRAFI